MTIPHILHQTWRTRDIPSKLDGYVRSWRRIHPSWEFRLYDDKDCRKLVATHYPSLLAQYDGYPRNIQRADLFRYLVVYHYGGVYADLDMECLKSIAPLLANRSCVFGIEAHFGKYLQRKLRYQAGYHVANCIFAAQPRHPFFDRLIECLPRVAPQATIDDEMVLETTGPYVLTRVFQESRATFPDVTLLPQINWMPPEYYGNRFPFNINIYCRHHAVGTWRWNRLLPWWRQLHRVREFWYPPSPWPGGSA